MALWERLPEEELVVKANELVMGQIAWSVLEYRVFIAHVSQISREDKRFKRQSVGVQQLCELSQVDTETLYSRAKGIADQLTQKNIVLERGEDGRREAGAVSVYASCKYKEETGELVGRFTEEMSPFLLELKDRFTMYYRRQALAMRSMYSMRFYEILKRYEYQGKFELRVDEFRNLFDLEDKYPRFVDLRRNVIDRAREELEEKADTTFEYNVVRDGQTPVSIQFDIQPVIDEEDALPNPSEQSPPEEPKLQSRYFQKFDGLSAEEQNQIQSRAERRAKEENPSAGKRVIEAQTWRYVSRIVRERYF